MKSKYLFTVILSLLFTSAAFGQNRSSVIAGRVTDQNGAVISGANVEIKNSKGATETTATDSNGNFSFSNTEAGNYRLKIEKTGFALLSQDVSSGQSNLVLTLEVFGVGATVEVAAETYTVEDNTTATKINVALKDVPQSVQVVNQNILRDRATFSFSEAVTQNVSGITRHTTDLTGSGAGDFLRFRGFSGSYNNSYLRDGLKQVNYGANETADVERIEVLKGAASVLYGRSEPGGVVNLVSKQPVSDNFISFDFTGGQFNFYRPQVDAGGKVFSDKLLYRLNFAYQYDGNFREDADGKRVFVAPVLLWKPTEKLQISFDAEYLRERRGMDVGQLLVNGRVPDVPVERSYGEPFNRSFQQNKNGGIRADTISTQIGRCKAHTERSFSITLYSAYFPRYISRRPFKLTAEPSTAISPRLILPNAGIIRTRMLPEDFRPEKLSIISWAVLNTATRTAFTITNSISRVLSFLIFRRPIFSRRLRRSVTSSRKIISARRCRNRDFRIVSATGSKRTAFTCRI